MVNLVKQRIKVGQVFDNPGGGTSEIVSVTKTGIYFKRRNSKILLKFKDMENAYNTLRGRKITTRDLKELNEKCFDSSKGGHSCNCTFLFSILKKCDLIKGDICGEGKINNPFSVELI